MKRNGTASPSSKARIVAIGAFALAALAVSGYPIVNTNASAGAQAARFGPSSPRGARSPPATPSSSWTTRSSVNRYPRPSSA